MLLWICGNCGYKHYGYEDSQKPCPKCGGKMLEVNNVYSLLGNYIKFGLFGKNRRVREKK